METQNTNVAAEIESLREQLRKDVAAIEQAHANDVEKVSRSITALKLDGDQLSDLLLEELHAGFCLLYTSPSPRDQRGSRMPSSA